MWRFAFNHGIWTPNNSQLLRVFSCLSSYDQENALKFAYRRDIKSYLAARLLVLYVSQRLFNLDPIRVFVRRDTNGRPYLKEYPNFDFNLSHNGDFTLLTSCLGMRTGVDVMRIELPPASVSVTDFVHKMKSLFGPSEWHLLDTPNFDDSEKIRNFFRLWCLKEAFVKNIGTGLRLDISTVEFNITGSTPKCTYPGLVDVEWTFEEHELPNSHVAAVAWHTRGTPDFCIRKEPFEVLSFDVLTETLSPWNEVIENIWPLFSSKELSPFSARSLLS